MNYDPGVIEEFARRLLKRARTAMVTHALMGGVILGFLGLGVGTGGAEVPTDGSGQGLVIGGLLGLAAGAWFGRQRAFQLRLEAQTSLVQVQIEKNTRTLAKVATGRQDGEREAA